MHCEQVREAVSARLDGAGPPIFGVDAHLEACAECRRWAQDAAVVTRLARTTLVPPLAGSGRSSGSGGSAGSGGSGGSGGSVGSDSSGDDLLAVVLAAAPGPGWAITGRVLRLALAAVGFAQFVLGVIQIASLGMAGGQASAGGMTADHLWHESAAWNIAIGAGYAWIALRGSRPSGALPMLTAFVAVLLLLSISDLLSGEVAAGALLTHGFVLLGYVILLALRHPGLDAPPGRRAWRLRLDVDEAGEAVRRTPTPIRGATARSDERRVA